MNRPSKIARALAVAIAACAYLVVAWLFVRRLAYPYDLEWMEGGELCHALRLLDGQSIYSPPSVDFIPFLYTPLYPALLALVGRVFGVGYFLARLVSIGSFIGATVLGYRFAVRASGSRAAAACAMALPWAAFAKTGTFYDLARPDSLWLLLTTAALVLVYRAARNDDGTRRTGLRRHGLAALAGALLVAAFFTKQTASPFMIAAGAALLLLDVRLVPAFGGALALCGLPALWLSNRATSGWFWTYVFRLHQEHAFFARRAFVETPLELLWIVGPALLVVPWALWRRRSPALVYAAFLALVGIAVASLAYGTQWAFQNAYIPGVYFPAVAIAVAAGRLSSTAEGAAPPKLRPAVVYALLAASVALLRFDPRPFVPTAADRAAGAELVARLAATDGDVLIPFHPFYAHLAGKRTYLHRMGVLDIWRAHLGAPKGLLEATRSHRWALAVFDDRISDNWWMWPGFLQEYMPAPAPPSPRVVSGAPTRPQYAFVPRPAPPPAPVPATGARTGTGTGTGAGTGTGTGAGAGTGTGAGTGAGTGTGTGAGRDTPIDREIQ